MIILSGATSSWQTDGLWRIAPAGLNWIAEGSRIQVGDRARIGNGARIGNEAHIGDGAHIAEGSHIGNEARIGNGAHIGNEAHIGSKATDVVDLGWADGYRKCIAQVNGVAYIGAGCRWFTLEEALAHWGAHANDRTLTMCLLQSAVAIAGYRGWEFK